MTSNLGSELIQEFAPGDYATMKHAVMEAVANRFRPEFVNRIDDVVVFHPLDRAQIRGIAALQIDSLRARLAEQDLGLELSDAALDLLGEAGFDPVYGARPLRRTIQSRLENELANRMLAGEFTAGDCIEIDAAQGELTFGRRRARAA